VSIHIPGEYRALVVKGLMDSAAPVAFQHGDSGTLKSRWPVG